MNGGATTTNLTVTSNAYFAGSSVFTSGGRLGVGTTTPWAELSVNQFNGGTAPMFTVASSSGALATTTAFIVDSNGRVGIGTSSPATSLDINGALRLSGSGVDTFYSPGGAPIPTKINVPLFNPGAYGQVFAMGLPSVAPDTSRVFTMLDARTSLHQPSFELLSPNESQYIGLSYEYGDSSIGHIVSSNSIGFQINGYEKMRVNYDGNIGIGTQLPGKILTVSYDDSQLRLTNPNGSPWDIGTNSTSWGVGDAGKLLFMPNGGAAPTSLLTLTLDNLVGISSTTPWAKLSVAGAAGGTVPLFMVSSSTSAFATSTAFVVNQNGLVGIGTTTPWRALSVKGNMAITGLTSSTAGNAVCILTSGEVVTAGNTTCVTSSQYTKHDIVSIGDASEIMKLRPVQYVNDEGGDARYGFVAEEVAAVDDKLVEHATADVTLNGHLFKKGDVLAVDYERYTGLLTKFVQDTNLKVEDLATTTDATTLDSSSFAGKFFSSLFVQITKWLASAANGIGSVFAKAFHASEEICVDDQCLTKEDVRSLLTIAHASSTPQVAGSAEVVATSTPPAEAAVISAQGANPATITTGTQYNDLGAIITAPQSALNLGIVAIIDGGATTTLNQITLDTSVAGTHTIEYRVIDQNGLMSIASRTVTVEAPAPIADAVPADSASSTPSTP